MARAWARRSRRCLNHPETWFQLALVGSTISLASLGRLWTFRTSVRSASPSARLDRLNSRQSTISANPSWHKEWIGSRAPEDSTQGGGR